MCMIPHWIEKINKKTSHVQNGLDLSSHISENDMMPKQIPLQIFLGQNVKFEEILCGCIVLQQSNYFVYIFVTTTTNLGSKSLVQKTIWKAGTSWKPGPISKELELEPVS